MDKQIVITFMGRRMTKRFGHYAIELPNGSLVRTNELSVVETTIREQLKLEAKGEKANHSTR